ncbi:MAG: cobalamin-dependent protein [Candidatus Methanomethylicus sp.]|nr:cobalamin-dependent protein [Candidatus Methanomethylicus sp.]
MKKREKIVKVLLAQFPLETHSRGIITVAGMLRDAGMEVILMGNALPEQIVETALQETVDVIGISTYCGGELALGEKVLKTAANRGIKDHTTFLIGGIFPPKDIPKLKKIGFDGVFLSATKDEIVSCIQNSVAVKSKELWNPIQAVSN